MVDILAEADVPLRSLGVPIPIPSRAPSRLEGGDEKEALVVQTVGPNVESDEESPKDPSSPFESPKGDHGGCPVILFYERDGQ
ncbi:hypothetical protein HAX54_009628 [Datura stramonium]|uniref:Uncharacterized protein n=1 Tax=Datura stramonium TaxID=4076 RepID=A0ABS8WXI2_DATST|nr:hypothetical protein [Datura stramonium]